MSGKKSGNFEVDDKWQPLINNYPYRLMVWRVFLGRMLLKRITLMHVTVYIVGAIVHVLEEWVGDFEENVCDFL